MDCSVSKGSMDRRKKTCFQITPRMNDLKAPLDQSCLLKTRRANSYASKDEAESLRLVMIHEANPGDLVGIPQKTFQWWEAPSHWSIGFNRDNSQKKRGLCPIKRAFGELPCSVDPQCLERWIKSIVKPSCLLNKL